MQMQVHTRMRVCLPYLRNKDDALLTRPQPPTALTVMHGSDRDKAGTVQPLRAEVLEPAVGSNPTSSASQLRACGQGLFTDGLCPLGPPWGCGGGLGRILDMSLGPWGKVPDHRVFCGVGGVIVPILQVKKPRPGEVERLV